MAGALTGLLAGAVASRILAVREEGRLREVRSRFTDRLRPGPMQRPRADLPELDRLETAVLGEFLADDRLQERAIDIGAISAGIIELSGLVMSEDEAHRAVALAQRIEGVDTVLNRLDIESRYPTGDFRPTTGLGGSSTFGRFEGRVGGMGRTRQGLEGEPDQRDDSQAMREMALYAADREQYVDEALIDIVEDRSTEVANPTRFRDDQLDNQSPRGQHVPTTLNRPPEALNSYARVGDRRSEPISDISPEQHPASDEGQESREV